MTRHPGTWAGRVALVLFGVVVALALLEGLLRLGAVIFRSRPAVESRVALDDANAYRVLCLGESTTAGLSWNDGAYPLQLERILNERAAGKAEFTVINGGMVATTTDVIVARLPALLAEHRPDIVVTMMGINDGRMHDPAFQVGGSLRVWKLAKMLYYSLRPADGATQAEELLLRARVTARNWPDVAVHLADQAIDLVPDDPRGYIILAQARTRANLIQPAFRAYDQAIEADGAAVLVYAFDVEDEYVKVFDRAMSRLDTDANALAARAVLALRRGEAAKALPLARKATEIDPRNAIALLLEAKSLQKARSLSEARAKLEAAAAVDPYVLELLVDRAIVRFPALRMVVERERREGRLEPSESLSSQARWLLRARHEMAERFKGLRLAGGWARIAEGETDEVVEQLRYFTEPTDDDLDPRLRLRAYGELAIIAWQNGDAEEAERYHGEIEAFLEQWVNPITEENYRELSRILHERGIPLVAVQYPMRRLNPLQRLLEPASGVVFVDNEKVFKEALLDRPYAEIFYDLFAGDFGHMTIEGNRILAANVAEAILDLAPQVAAQ